MKVVFILLWIASMLSGCGTIFSELEYYHDSSNQSVPHPTDKVPYPENACSNSRMLSENMYSGVQFDSRVIYYSPSEGYWLAVIPAFIDLPFSVIADTLVLPIKVYENSTIECELPSE